ncbi:MAG: peptide chain release factor 1 [Elusimicrobia bacterium HGW-Elusimicrobia-1]|jgi:peptide chain release factor 1|nr:MAG: peptide chain release factor 1 [Elusimicrobia bacterium HGW-Elusimicrobia-1]
MLDYLNKLEARYNRIEERLCREATSTDGEAYLAAVKELSEIKPAVELARRARTLEADMASSRTLITEAHEKGDPNLAELAKEEIASLESELSKVQKSLRLALVPPDPAESKNVIIEIRAGTGGEEAAIFAGELFRMYSRFADAHGMEIEIYDSSPTDLHGFKEIIFTVKGAGAGKYLRFESGVHRVQRVPATEASGRIHTSAVSVAVMPEADDVDVKIDEKDLRIDTYRASGAGGQHVNKTDSAVRITHIPTGLVVASQEDRSQIKNRAKAMKLLRARIQDAERMRQESVRADLRKKQIGTGDRSEKIRTYNFPQNRLTDHRINYSVHNLPDVMEGCLDELVTKLAEAASEKAFARLSEDMKESSAENPASGEKK